MSDFSQGATIIKGFNRGLGTFFAGMLAFLFAWLSVLAGPWEKVVIVISFFIAGLSQNLLNNSITFSYIILLKKEYMQS